MSIALEQTDVSAQAERGMNTHPAGVLSPAQQQAALTLINARRAQAGLPALVGFAAPQPISPAAPTDERQQAFQAGQARLEKRRAELLAAREPAPRRAARPHLAQADSSTPAAPPRRAKAPPPHPTYPTHIAVWPQVALAAARCGAAGAIRAWELARALDPGGRGWVERKSLRSWLSSLPVSRSTHSRWLQRALALGLLRKARGNTRLLYAGLEKTALLFGVEDPGERIQLAVQDLAARDWKSAAWAGALARFGGPVSRAALQVVTGVQPRSQRNYERRFRARHSDAPHGGLHVRANYALDDTFQPRDLQGYREFRRRYAFVVRIAGAEKIAYRLPNTYQVNPVCVRAAGGRYRSWQIRLHNATQVVVSELSGRAPGAASSESFAPAHATHPAGDSASCGAGPCPARAACRVGDANPGGRRRRYYQRYRSLKRALQQARQGKRPGGEIYEWMAGGVARKSTPFPHCHWWRLVRE